MAKCRLTERIVIEHFLGEEQNERGFEISSWDKNYYKCWAAYRTVKGKEYIAAKATNSQNIVTFTVRHCNKTKVLLTPGASKDFRIKFNEHYYDIQYASDYEDRHDWIDIKCEVINNG